MLISETKVEAHEKWLGRASCKLHNFLEIQIISKKSFNSGTFDNKINWIINFYNFYNFIVTSVFDLKNII